MREKLVSFWQRFGPPLEALGLILLIIANTYMKDSIAFRVVAIVYWVICLVLYIITEQNYRKVRFWVFLILGLLLVINQLPQLTGAAN
ncbi:hypothetical protein [Chitinophaga sp.]|uniref:hypothetical protein n=1 Tax=Chitinophaga sp. TaxID=1869181 RepID=UPI002C04FB56|nr:hypothetical protein [Chitinophaga sp.]HWV64821.1 hypothetical protein [Chitinophaga sp.]